MQVYAAFPAEDTLLVQWWYRMVQADELVSTFGPRFESLSAFFGAFREPSKLLYETDGEYGIAVAYWVDPSPLSGAFFGMWFAPHWRNTRKAYRATVAALGVAFHAFAYPVLIFTAEHARTAKLHRHAGATELGMIPGLYGGTDPAHVSYMTLEAYERLAAKAEKVAA